jgi:methionyl aminopeptidase
MPAKLKTEADVAVLRESGLILAEVLDTLAREAVLGTKLSYLDRHARGLIASRGATPTFLGYTPEGARVGYPAAICASVNDTIVHGLPGEYRLRAGDVLKIDAGVTYRGYVTDAALTVAIPPIAPAVSRLLETTRHALDEAILSCVPGGRLGDIGWAIERVAKRGKCTVITGLTGHGVGFELHEDPTVYNYGTKGEGMKLVPGLVLAIEPMFSLGSGDIYQYPDDSYGTADKSIAAHFEHTVVITKGGCEVLTVLPKR